MRRVGIYGYAAVTDTALSMRNSERERQEGALEDKYLSGVSLKHVSKLSVNSGIAAKAALETATTAPDPERIGVILGSSLGSLAPIIDYYSESIENGPDGVSPMAFPSTVSNAPGSLIGIWFGLKGPSITLSNGSSSSLDAIGFAYEEIKYNGFEHFLAGGADQIVEGVEEGYASIHGLAGGERELLQDGAGVALVSVMRQEDGAPHLAEIVDYENLKISAGEETPRIMLQTVRAMLDRHGVDVADVRAVTGCKPYQETQHRLEALMREELGLEVAYWNRKAEGYENYLAANGVIGLVRLLNDSAKNGEARPSHTLLFETSIRGKISALLLRQ